MEPRVEEFAALLTLLRLGSRGGSWNVTAAEVVSAGSARALLDESDGDGLFADPDLERALEQARSDVNRWSEEGLKWVSVLDRDYPARLLGIREVPPFMFYEGVLRESDDGMAVVGSRSASRWGLDLAAETARHLVDQGMTVIAGLAEGIDTSAHRAALDAGGRSVAVIGTGITKLYPATNRALQQELGQRGLVLSQFYPDAAPTRRSFPMRNATMSGYSLATIVIEAGEHSGTRIQARLAGEHGRPVILTDRVAETTTWGSALAGRPNVYVAKSFQELKEAISDVREAPVRLKMALDELTSV